MPFKSRAQKKWMYATHPEMAKRWQAETPPEKKLPEHKTKKAPRARKAEKAHGDNHR